jgi:hypothetical protein
VQLVLGGERGAGSGERGAGSGGWEQGVGGGGGGGGPPGGFGRGVDAQALQKLPADLREPGIGDVARPVEVDLLLVRDDTLVHHEDPVGEQDGLLDVVRHQQHRAAAPLPQLAHQTLGLDAGERVERAERLVQQQEIGLAHQRPCQGGALGLAAGEGLGPCVRTVAQTDLLQGLVGDGAGRLAGQAEQDVAPHLLPRHQPGCLEGDRLAARDQDGALDVPVESGEDAQQGGLAAATAAQQGHELARPHVESEVVDDGAAVEGAGQALDAHGMRGAWCLGCLGCVGRLGGVGHPGAQRPVNVGRHCSSSLSRERTMKSASRPRKA